MLKNVGTGTKPAVGFLLALLLLSCSLGIYHFTLSATIDRYENLMGSASASDAAPLEGRRIGESAATRKATALFMGLGGIAAALFIGLSMAKAGNKPLEDAVSLIEKAAQGDFSRPSQSTESAAPPGLARALDKLSANLDKRFKEMTDTMTALTAASGELAAISEEMTRDAGSTSEKLTAAADAADGMNSAVDSVVGSMEQTSESVGLVVTAAEEMTATISEIAGNSEKARSFTDQAVALAGQNRENVKNLGMVATDISRVTEMINEISEQTNLLALNATIEAARAGEAGKGFAVVADEIKALARQTAGATVEIKSKIEGIQETALKTGNGIKKVGGILRETNEIVSGIATAVEQQSVSTREIAENSTHASREIEGVRTNIDTTSTVSIRIKGEILEVDSAARGIWDISRKVNNQAKNMAVLTDKLKKTVTVPAG